MALYRQLQLSFWGDAFVVDKLFNLCEKLKYPLEGIFKNVEGFEEKIRGLEGACMDLGEEEIKEEIKEKEEEEIKKEIEEVEEIELEKSSKNLNSAADVYTDLVNAVESVGISEIVEVFNNNIHPITPLEFERLQDWCKDMSCDSIIMAINEAAFHNARSMKYIFHNSKVIPEQCPILWERITKNPIAYAL